MVTGIWEEFLKIVKDEVGSRVVETWFKAVTLHQWDSLENTVYLKAPNAFVKNWLLSNYMPLMQLHLGRLFNVDKPKIVLCEQTHADDTRCESKTDEFVPAVISQRVAKKVLKTGIVPFSFGGQRGHVNRSYSFNTFVVGPSNSLAYAAAHAITEKPGRLYNPLFIYGGSGLGKTHLLHSIGNSIRMAHAKANVLYQPTDRFVNEFINAIRFDKVHKFHAKYKDVDVLLIDDIQFLSNKEQTQEAFFHIFNTMHESSKQIVFSSDTPPQEIKGLAERLRSRLAWGLVADIQQPALETKIAILKKKAEQSNEELTDDVAEFVASRVISNIRELEGALIRVMAFASLTKQPVSYDLAQKVLATAKEQSPQEATLEGVVKCVRKHYAYKVDELRSKSRNKDLSFARQVAMFLMKKVCHKSLRDIGDYFGGRDHSTVKHAIHKVTWHAEKNPGFKQKLRTMEQEAVY